MASPRLTYPRSHRLSSPPKFQAVYDARVRETRGPLVIYALPNRLTFSRLGLSVSRKVGTAPRRNRIKRLLREAFRAMQHDVPAGYDLVIVLRPHIPLSLEEYKSSVGGAIVKLSRAWTRRAEMQPSASIAEEAPQPPADT